MKIKTVIGVLKQARKLLERGWTQGTFARRKDGHETNEMSPAAVKFCMVGALARASGNTDPVPARRLVQKCVPEGFITVYNDKQGRKKEEILAVFDCAIKKATAQKERR